LSRLHDQRVTADGGFRLAARMSGSMSFSGSVSLHAAYETFNSGRGIDLLGSG
jgi:hypothetical protein